MKILLSISFIIFSPLILFAQWDSASTVGFIPRYSHTSCVVDGKIYVIGGGGNGTIVILDAVEVYDPATDSWSTLKTTGSYTPRAWLSSNVVNGKIYVIGGGESQNSPTNVLEVFDPATNAWSTPKTTGTFMPCIYQSSSVVNGKIYVFGGSSGSTINNLVVFDPATNTWSTPVTVGTFTRRTYVTTAVVGGKIYVIGGQDAKGFTNVLDVFDPSTNSWSTPVTTGTCSARGMMTSSVVNDKIYVMGGHDNNGVLNTLEVFDPLTNTWSTPVTTGVFTPRYFLTSGAVNTDIYVMGGLSGGGRPLNTNEVLHLENGQVFSDSNATTHIDTLDFGTFDKLVNPPKDSFIFVANTGEVELNVTSQNIVGTNAADFMIALTSIAFVRITVPYGLPPSRKDNAKVTIRFSPNSPNGVRTAELHIKAGGQDRVVILIARINRALKNVVTNAVFDTTFLCLDQTRSMFVANQNDFPITVTDVTLGGANAADFSVLTPIPLVVQPNSQDEIQLRYTPSVVGPSSATATLTYDLPKGSSEVLPLSAFGEQLQAHFSARNNIHILAGEDALFPIYAKSPMQQFSSTSFTLTFDYDHSHLDAYDYMQENTLTSQGGYTVNTDTEGYNEFSYQTLDGSVVSGGNLTEGTPMVYIKFKSHLNPGDDPLKFHQSYDINYHVNFDHSPAAPGCIALDAPSGRITIDSTCETPYLLHDTTLFPSESYIEPVRPNPVFNGHASFTFDVPKEDIVRLDIFDMLGNKISSILEEAKKPGTYEVKWDASKLIAGMYYVRLQTAGQVKMREMVIVR